MPSFFYDPFSIQQQREQRHAMRQGKSHSSSESMTSVLDLSTVASRGRDNRSSAALSQQSGTGILGNATNSQFGKRIMRDRRDGNSASIDSL